MFEALHLHAKALHGEMVGIFWIMLPLVVSFLVLFEILKGQDQSPNVSEILRRTVISILLMLSFDTVITAISVIADGIANEIQGTGNVWEAIQNLGPNSQGESGSLFNFQRHIIYFFAIGAYLIAYIGYFASVALVNFAWGILYICAPLMILCYIPRATANVTGNLYRGLVSVATWKILWHLLGALLLKMALDPKVVGVEDYILSMVMNLLIGLSMLLVPFFARSLIGDGLQSASAALAAAPGLMAAKATTLASKQLARRAAGKTANAGAFAAKPLTNPFVGRAKILERRTRPLRTKLRRRYKNIGLPQEAR